MESRDQHFFSLSDETARVAQERESVLVHVSKQGTETKFIRRPSKENRSSDKEEKGADEPHTITAFYLGASCSLALHKLCWEGEFTKCLGLFFLLLFFCKMT